jgi:hypothetical protein
MRHRASDCRSQERACSNRDEDLIAHLAYLAPEIADRDRLAAFMVSMAIQVLSDRCGLRSDPGRVAAKPIIAGG